MRRLSIGLVLALLLPACAQPTEAQGVGSATLDDESGGVPGVAPQAMPSSSSTPMAPVAAGGAGAGGEPSTQAQAGSGSAPAELCGNGVRDSDEECDGSDLPSASCASLGFEGDAAELGCTSACRLDRAVCSGCASGAAQCL